ncbi:hypothetical protein [Nocardia abscessus]|uniref:hypothetical protein n=1 Tax=Nocardia abscessus TaxID=120957 RepID=UPI00245731F5|nr:hypothetical protein [Nocardia abscessus]
MRWPAVTPTPYRPPALSSPTPSQQAVLAALATTARLEANQRLSDDEKNFLELPRCSYFLTTERVLLG